MATITTSLTPSPRFFPYQGISDPNRDQSVVPRGELVFSGQREAITDGGVGNDQLLAINCQLPQNFSYVLTDVGLTIEMVDVGDTCLWDETVQLTALDAQTVANRFLTTPYPGISTGNFLELEGAAGRQVYAFNSLPRFVILPPAGDNASVLISAGNPTLNDNSSTATFLVRVLMYDISQAYHYEVNTPIPVR